MTIFSSTSNKVTGFLVAALLLQLCYFATILAGFDALSLLHETNAYRETNSDQDEESLPPPIWASEKRDHPAPTKLQMKREIKIIHATLPPRWKQQSHSNLSSDFSLIFDVIYNKTKAEFSFANDLEAISSQNLSDLTYSPTIQETSEFEESFAQIKKYGINDDANDEQLDKTHSDNNNRARKHSPKKCILFRFLPGCSCLGGVKSGSICAPHGTGRCEFGLCFVSNRPTPRTLKMIPSFQKVSTSSDNILKNFYFAPSIADRIFRTKLDLAAKHQDYFLQKMQHQCRLQRTETDLTRNEQSSYRCRAESYPSNPHRLDADFLRNKRTNNSLIRKLYNKSQPIFLRLYCMIEIFMGVTNTELTIAGCLGLAVDMMSRDSSVVVDVVVPIATDHRNHHFSQFLVDMVDFDFLKRIAKYYGVEIIMSSLVDSENSIVVDPHKKLKNNYGLSENECEKCIWFAPLPSHCFKCCVVDSRILAGPTNSNLDINMATSWAERSLPLSELYRQFRERDIQMKNNISLSQKALKDEIELNKVNFSVFGGRNLLKQVYAFAGMRLSQNNTELWKLRTAAEVRKFAELERRLDPDLWYSNVRQEKDRMLKKLEKKRDEKTSMQLLDNISFLDASMEDKLWENLVTFDHDWNSCINHKLQPFENMKNNNKRNLMMNQNPYRLEFRKDETYLLSLKVTGVHFTTYHEFRSASWLPTLDWLQPPKNARIAAQNIIRQILEKSLDKKTFLAVHLRYEDDAYVWTMDYLKYETDKPVSREEQVKEYEQREKFLGKFAEANNNEKSKRGIHDMKPFLMLNHLKKVLDKIDRLAQDLKVGAVFISNAAPIEEYQQRFAQKSSFFAPWFSGASFVDKAKERTRFSSLVDRIVIESSTVAVVWDPFTGLSSFSQKIYDHRCRRMRGLTTFSYSIGVGQERDESLVLEC